MMSEIHALVKKGGIKGTKTRAPFFVVDAALSFEDATSYELSILNGDVGDGTRSGGMVWSMPKGLVVPKSFAIYDKFESAAAQMGEAGWPLHLRQTGGDLTPQGPGVINLSYVFSHPADAGLSISAAYHRLCDPIIGFLKDAYGLESYCSEVSGAFCDGKFNVVIDGIKIAGTAQKWRPYRAADGSKHIGVLAHAALIADADVSALIEASNRFYKLCDVDRQIDVACQTSLARLIPAGRFDRAEFMAGLCQALVEASE